MDVVIWFAVILVFAPALVGLANLDFSAILVGLFFGALALGAGGLCARVCELARIVRD
jgi:hypothetical protein